MAKALKVAAVVLVVGALAVVTAGAALGFGVALGTTFLGVSAGTILLAAGALSTAATLLQKKPQIPGSQIDRLNASIDPRAFRKTVLGSTAMATDVRYQEWHGSKQDRCSWIVALASHRVTSVDEIWINDEIAWTSSGGAQGRYVGYFSVPNVVLEGSSTTIIVGTSGKWNSSRRLTGCAYLHLLFRTTGLTKKAESPFSGGIPSRITIIGKGAPLYDPRRDSTVSGGSGLMRAADQGTWRFNTDDGAEIGENLALLVLRVLLGTRINGKLATGCGLPAKRINLASFQVAANQCDEMVNRSTGGSEPRFRGAGVLSEGDDPRTVLSALCAACNGRLRDTAGRLSLVIMHNDLAVAAADDGLNADDVMGAFTWNPDPSMEATPNVVRGKYTDASPNSLYQLLPYPDVSIASTTGIERVLPLDLAFVESASQAQRVGKQALQRRQYDRTFVAPFDIRAWQYPVGAILPFTFPPLGFVRQLFRVAEQEVGPGGLCNMTLSFESEAIYQWDADDRAPVTPASTVVYDPALAALVQAISDLAEVDITGLIANSSARNLDLLINTASTVSVSTHERSYNDKTVSVTGATVTPSPAAVAGDKVGVFYDDADRAGGTVTYQYGVLAGGAGEIAQFYSSAENPFRHFVALLPVPATGTTSGGSGTGTGSGGTGGGTGGGYFKTVEP